MRAGTCGGRDAYAAYENNVGVLSKTFMRMTNAAMPHLAGTGKPGEVPAVAEAHRKVILVRGSAGARARALWPAMLTR